MIRSQPNAASSSGNETCHSHSSRLSELKPRSGMKSGVITAGIATSRPIFEKLMALANARTICEPEIGERRQQDLAAKKLAR
jgi:hypothetical protein